MQSATSPTGLLLAKEEWDFRALPPEQVPFCFQYEYAREAPGRIEHVRWACGKNTADKELIAAQERRLSPIFGDAVERAIVYDCPEFPISPWQAIPADRRQQRMVPYIALMSGPLPPVMEWQLAGIARNQEGETLEGYVVSTAKNESGQTPFAFAVVRLDPARSNAELKAQFARFLLRREERKKVSGRAESPMDALHALAARRVLIKCGLDAAKAVQFFKASVWREPLYTSERALQRAADRAPRIRRLLYG